LVDAVVELPVEVQVLFRERAIQRNPYRLILERGAFQPAQVCLEFTSPTNLAWVCIDEFLDQLC
jgi:hypothetical protein